MKKNKDIITELSQTAPALLQGDFIPLYQVPDQYFDQLTDSILKKIKSGELPNYTFTQKNPYTVPSTYFSDLPEIVLQKVKSTNSTQTVFDEMENISPLLNTINKNNVYTIPENYFAQIEKRIEPIAKPAGTVTTKSRVFNLYRMAVAAVITAIIGIGIFLLTNTNNHDNSNVVKTELHNLSEDDISTFLTQGDNTDNTSAPTLTSSAVTVDLKKAIKDLPDEEINQFLQDSEIMEGI